MQEHAVLNRLWSRALLEELSRHGITQVCVAPGSRSTPLILEASHHPKLTLHTHFDERGLGFLALGMAKASNQPVAIIVTSGTAVANLLPAIAESGLTREKLVVLTADRPVELIDCGANQAIQQVDIFAHHVTASLALPSPSASIPLNWLLTTIDQAMFTQQREGGAVHINCPYPEPLYVAEDANFDRPYWRNVSDWYDAAHPYTSQLALTHVTTEGGPVSCWNKKGLIIAGSMPIEQAEPLKLLAEQLHWPLLCDPQSGLSSAWDGFDIWMQHPDALAQLSACDCIVQCGSRIVSKRLNQWLAEQGMKRGCNYVYVAPTLKKDNPHHLPQHHIVSEIGAWATASLSLLSGQTVTFADWGLPLTVYAREVAQIATDQIDQEDALSELTLALRLSEWSQGTDLFIGNSLMVRLVDMFSCHLHQSVYTNRGASGIDGLVATASGVQRATGQPLLLLMGDTSLLHDLNSLALLSKCQAPVVLVVTNNDGGAIFDLLPVPSAEKRALYQVPHGLQFESAAKQFGLAYANPSIYADFRQRIARHLAQGRGALLLEVTTHNGQAATQIKHVVEQLHAR